MQKCSPQILCQSEQALSALPRIPISPTDNRQFQRRWTNRLQTQDREIINPLRAFPSILSIRDFRLRIRNSDFDRSSSQATIKLLALDPLTVLRCLRQAGSGVNSPKVAIRTLPDLLAYLGSSAVQRAIDLPVIDSQGTEPIRQLWLHAVATAVAARDLAKLTGAMDPEEAYLRGLLHDLAHWLTYSGHHHHGAPWPMTVSQWLDDWHLPSYLGRQTGDFESCMDPRQLVEAKPNNIIVAAEMMAELADFCHPGETDLLQRELLMSVVSRETLVQTRELARDVKRTLHEVGLDTSPLSVETNDFVADEDLHLFSNRLRGNQTELIVNLLQCSKTTSSRYLTTIATASPLRHLEFERAYLIRWNPEVNRVWVHAKADLTIRRLEPQMIVPTAAECATLNETAKTEQPITVERTHEQSGLMQFLSSDSALLVPMNRGFSVPSFLLLDRSVSGQALRPRTDVPNALALGGMIALLIDNLQMRLQRTRAQRFALTDPLTRLANRGVGMLALGREMARAHREGRDLSVLMVDLDEFKDLNDTHGHLVGDQALRVTANVMRKTVRRSDVVCRYGGEEFLVILPDTDPEEASVIAARLFTEVDIAGQEIDLPLTASIGLSCLRPGDENTDALVGRADKALYASKNRGRNRFSIDI